MNTAVHFSSKTDLWSTPQAFYDKLNAEFGFTLDPCATPENAKCEKFYTIADDGLSQDWSEDIVFVNPPYGRAIRDWIKKALDESRKGATVVMLIPARTDTSYWHDYVLGGGRTSPLHQRAAKVRRLQKLGSISERGCHIRGRR